MHLRGGRGKCGLGILVVLVQFVLGQGGDGDFIICSSEVLNRELMCPEGAVIDIQQATVAHLAAIGTVNACRYNPVQSLLEILYNQSSSCKLNLPFLSCHGKHSCLMNGSTANVSLPDCDKGSDPHRRYSDVLHFRYTCYIPEASVMLPSTNDVTSNMIDVFSPGFSDVTEEGRYDVTCSITPSVKTDGEIKLAVLQKLLMVEGPLQDLHNSTCSESLQMSLSGKLFFCYQAIPRRIRNDNIGKYRGHNFILVYRSDGTVKHKFWNQFKATTVDSGDPVNMVISCTDNLPTTTTTKIMRESAESTEKSQNDGVIIGSVLGVLLLIVLVALIVVIGMYRRIIKRKDEAAAAPSGDVYSDTTSGELNNGGNTSGYINTSGPQKPYENLTGTYTSIMADNDANTTTDRGPNNDEPGDYDYIKVVDNRNHYNNVVGTNGGAKYEDLLTATRDTKKPEPYEELSIAAK